MIELEAEGQTLVLDAGLPLDAERIPAHDLLPESGLWGEADGSILGLVISHGHPDHYGLADLVAPSVPIYMGEAAASILREASSSHWLGFPGSRDISATGNRCDSGPSRSHRG